MAVLYILTLSQYYYSIECNDQSHPSYLDYSLKNKRKTSISHFTSGIKQMWSSQAILEAPKILISYSKGSHNAELSGWKIQCVQQYRGKVKKWFSSRHAKKVEQRPEFMKTCYIRQTVEMGTSTCGTSTVFPVCFILCVSSFSLSCFRYLRLHPQLFYLEVNSWILLCWWYFFATQVKDWICCGVNLEVLALA